MATERKVGVDPFLERRHAGFLESCNLVLRERFVGEVAKRGPAPQRQALQQRMGRQLRTPRRERAPALVDELLEAVGIELPRLDPEHITGGTRDENAVGLAAPAPPSQRLAKLRDVDLDDLRGRRRRTVPPELVDQAIGGDDLVAVKEQNGEHRALLRSAEGDLTSLPADLERPEDPKLHPRSASVNRADSRHNPPGDASIG